MKRLRLSLGLITAALLTWALLPAVSAEAYPGTTSGCYGINKKGNYNRIHIDVSGIVSGGKVAGRAKEAVTARCQRVNSLPVIRMVIDHVWLTVNGTTRAAAGIHQTTTHAAVRSHTSYVSVPCTATLRAIAQVHYVYYDHSTVRSYKVYGQKFSRPC